MHVSDGVKRLLLLTVGALLLAGCGGAAPASSSVPPDGPGAAETRAAAFSSDALEVNPPANAEKLPGAEYGLIRNGDDLTPTLTLRSLSCRDAGTIDVATDEADFLVQITAFRNWTCREALEQAKRSTGDNPQGLKVGLMYREGGASQQPQVSLIWGNGTSVTYAVRGLYRAS